MPLVLKRIENGIGELTLNHAAKRNALSAALIAELIAGLEELAAASVRSVLLRAPAGSKVWSAGHDVNELPVPGRDPLPYNDPLRRVVRAIELLPAPVIAMIEGGVWGGACELAVTCDVVIATPDATFALTPARLGVPYNMVGVLNLMRTIGLPVLKEMLFTARPITAERALRVGMINHIAAPEDLERFAFEIAGQIAETSPLCVALMKEELRLLSEARPLGPEAFERLQAMRRDIYNSRDYQEGIRAFLERRKPDFSPGG
jgi:methylmalonyl-CoA decarboxylase